MRPSRLVTFLMLLAGQLNIVGILVFTKFFSNTYLIEFYPTVFSRVGIAMIVLWGAAFCAAAFRYYAVPSLLGVFAAVKAVYFGTWVFWIIKHGAELSTIWSTSPLTAIHYAAYGPHDLIACLFFTIVFSMTIRHPPTISIQVDQVY